ncbi:Serine/arginine-rich splicing factor SR45a [Zea mays]|uniref:Serine/arginine-rich splicing factor SR45a n=1 Tax=Zea mays TaxID=4577 RepID=A0A3L6FIU2_MAIZE|nr:Serine/arginine-rich splicing factor SR45a [Zea mays]
MLDAFSAAPRHQLRPAAWYRSTRFASQAYRATAPFARADWQAACAIHASNSTGGGGHDASSNTQPTPRVNSDCLIKAFRGHIVLPLPDKNTVESQVGSKGVGWRAEDEGDHVGQPRRWHEQANHGDNMAKDNPPITFAIAACETQDVNVIVLPVIGLSGDTTMFGVGNVDSSDAENPGKQPVIDASIVYDPWTREPRGFGFVTMAATKEADHCIKYLDCYVLQGQVIIVEKNILLFCLHHRESEIASHSLHIHKVLLDCDDVQADALIVDRLASL